MSDLRQMGEANTLNARSRQFTSAKLFQRAGEIYEQEFAAKDGRITATFELVIVLMKMV